MRVSPNRQMLAIAFTIKKESIPHIFLYKLGDNIKKNQRETIFRYFHIIKEILIQSHRLLWL